MERAYIQIKENSNKQLVVEAKLVNGTLWLTKHEMADLFNVFVSVIDHNIRSAFKSSLLCEEEVTRVQRTEENGHVHETVYYNLEALVFVSYRVASLEARIFRQWTMKALRAFCESEQKKRADVLVVYNLDSLLTSITLN